MPFLLNVGLSKKVGLPDYGSLGASCHVELELSSHIFDRNPEIFQHEVRSAFAACREAVEEELAGARAIRASEKCPRSAPHIEVSEHSSQRGPGATAKQLDYAARLAAQIEGLGNRGLEKLVQQSFGRSRAELSSLEASRLIDTLRQIKSGQLKLPEILEREAA